MTDEIESKKPFYKKRRFWVLGVILALLFSWVLIPAGLIAMIVGGLMLCFNKSVQTARKILGIGALVFLIGLWLAMPADEMSEMANENNEKTALEAEEVKEEKEEVKEEVKKVTQPAVREVTLDELIEQQEKENVEKLESIFDDMVELTGGAIVDIYKNPYADDWRQIHVVVSDAWYYTPAHEQERFIQNAGDAVKAALYSAGVVKEGGAVIVTFFDEAGKEIAKGGVMGGYKIH